jgi:hypothetical protein
MANTRSFSNNKPKGNSKKKEFVDFLTKLD